MTKTLKVTFAAILVTGAGLQSTATAHYLWIAIDKEGGEHGTAHIYFEEGPKPGDGKYLDPFVKDGTVWLRTVESPKPVVLKTKVTEKPGKRWLSATLSASGSRSIDMYGKWGVYRYGKTDVLLHYYTRHIEAASHDDLHELDRAKQMSLEMCPHEANGEMEIKVRWKGKSVAGRKVYIRGPKKFRKTIKTDKRGVAAFKLGEEGQYLFRTSVEEKEKSGTDGGKKYSMVRHNGTLVMKLPLGADSK